MTLEEIKNAAIDRFLDLSSYSYNVRGTFEAGAIWALCNQSRFALSDNSVEFLTDKIENLLFHYNVDFISIQDSFKKEKFIKSLLELIEEYNKEQMILKNSEIDMLNIRNKSDHEVSGMEVEACNNEVYNKIQEVRAIKKELRETKQKVEENNKIIADLNKLIWSLTYDKEELVNELKSLKK